MSWSSGQPALISYSVIPVDNVLDLTLCVDNAAFGDTYEEQASEVARIFRELAERLERNPDYLDPKSGVLASLKDANGNRVGSLTPKALF